MDGGGPVDERAVVSAGHSEFDWRFGYGFPLDDRNGHQTADVTFGVERRRSVSSRNTVFVTTHLTPRRSARFGGQSFCAVPTCQRPSAARFSEMV